MKEYILFLIALLCLDGLFYLEKAIRRLIKKNFSFGIFETFSIFLGFLGIEEGQTELADGVAGDGGILKQQSFNNRHIQLIKGGKRLENVI